MKLLIGITASSGVIHFPFYLTYLRQHFPEIQIIMSESSKHFISPDALRLLDCKVYLNLFPWNNEGSHTALAGWADLFVILPATANILAQSAQGLAGSLLATTILCHEQPVIFFPNMNNAMWNAKATQRNVSILSGYGHIIVPPIEQVGFEVAKGKLQTGGYMPTPMEVVPLLKAEYEKRLKVLND